MTTQKPVIAILGGTGNEGPGLAMRWANAGYKVIIGSRQAQKAETTAAELNQNLGINTIIGKENADAARSANICVLTVVASAHQPALEGTQSARAGNDQINIFFVSVSNDLSRSVTANQHWDGFNTLFQ